MVAVIGRCSGGEKKEVQGALGRRGRNVVIGGWLLVGHGGEEIILSYCLGVWFEPTSNKSECQRMAGVLLISDIELWLSEDDRLVRMCSSASESTLSMLDRRVI